MKSRPSLRARRAKQSRGRKAPQGPWIALLSLARRDEMNELRCKVLVIGGGPGGYVAAIRVGPARPRHDPRRSRPARRNLSQRRLHSLEGADPRCRRGAWPARAASARRYRALDRAAEARFRPHDRLEGFDRHAPHWRRRRALEEGQGAHTPRDGDDRRRQDGDRPRRHRRDPHRRRASCSRDRLGAGGIARAQVRRRRSCLRPMRLR